MTNKKDKGICPFDQECYIKNYIYKIRYKCNYNYFVSTSDFLKNCILGYSSNISNTLKIGETKSIFPKYVENATKKIQNWLVQHK